MISIWGLLILSFILFYFLSFYRSLSKLPPGPFPLPFVGNFLNQLNPPYIVDDLIRLSKSFGSVFTIHMPSPVVNICDYDTLKEAHKGDDISGRAVSELTTMLLHVPNGGIVFSSGDNWKEQRRAAIGFLRDFGMGKNLMEQKVLSSADEMLRSLRNETNLQAIDMHRPIQLFVANVINEFLFGFRYDYDNCERLFEYVNDVTRVFVDVAKSKSFLAALRFPILRFIPFFKNEVQKIYDKVIDLRRYPFEEAERLKKTYNEDEEPSNFVHAYMQKMKENAALDIDQINDCCNDLFVAGQETTTTTLRWAMLIMATNLDKQEKIRNEIYAVVGRERLATLADKPKMPYTVAAIHEIQRMANIIPINFVLLHRVTVDTTIGHFKIAKDTLVNGDLYQIHKTDPHFVDPEKYLPERYIAEDGKTFRKELIDRTIPFGIGKRQCAGEGMARVELFIGLTAILQNFRVLPTAENEVNLEPVYTQAMLPKPQKLRLEPLV